MLDDDIVDEGSDVPFKNDRSLTKTIMCAEFFGTCGLMLAVNMSDGSTYTSLVLYLLLILTGGFSGGLLNPAVTVGVYVERKKFR